MKFTEEELSAYAKFVMTSKNLVQSELPNVKKALESALSRVYRAVAFDIDGTLTATDARSKSIPVVPVDKEMAKQVAILLKRGTPVFLITGRGSSAKQAAESIWRDAKLSFWQVRRLYCILHNGVSLLSTTSTNPSQFLGNKETLVHWPDKDHFTEIFQTKLNEAGFKVGKYRLQPKDHSIRITTDSRQLREDLFNFSTQFVNLNTRKLELHVAAGVYANLFTMDISATNKREALSHIAKKLEVETSQVLCIGDMGGEGGNDFDLLDSNSGFSVDQFSNEPSRCFPIGRMNGSGLYEQIKGPAATQELLNRLLLFPDLSIRPKDKNKYLTQLRGFEKLAAARSRSETERTIQHLRLRLSHLIDDPDSLTTTLNVDDIYDMRSGGVRLKDWEFSELELFEAYTTLFPRKELGTMIAAPQMRRSMYVDSGLLLRGPLYYQCLLGDEEFKKNQYFTSYIEVDPENWTA